MSKAQTSTWSFQLLEGLQQCSPTEHPLQSIFHPIFSISNWIIYPWLTGEVDGYGGYKMGKRKTWVLKALHRDQKTFGNTKSSQWRELQNKSPKISVLRSCRAHTWWSWKALTHKRASNKDIQAGVLTLSRWWLQQPWGQREQKCQMPVLFALLKHTAPFPRS